MKLVYDDDGRAHMVGRAKELECTVAQVNLEEKAAFMRGHSP